MYLFEYNAAIVRNTLHKRTVIIVTVPIRTLVADYKAIKQGTSTEFRIPPRYRRGFDPFGLIHCVTAEKSEHIS
jgi:hypothetical protein